MWLFRRDPESAPLAVEAQGPQYSSPSHAAALGRSFEWHLRGEPLRLLLSTVASVGGQYAALGVMALTVFTSTTLFIHCDSRVEPMLVAFACECTKSSMRYFVLLALVVSLLIALRQIVRQRIYYEMLRRGVLLDFEAVSPLQDNLFILLCGCLAFSLSHIFVVAWQYNHDEKTWMDFMSFVNTLVTRYLAHSCVFLAFLATAYDTEGQLLPLSKYVEEDPQAAQCLIKHMLVIPESAAVSAVQRGLCMPGMSAYSSDQMYAALVTQCEASAEVSQAGTTSMAEKLLEQARPERHTKFLAELWPACLLLDPRLQDEESARFKRVWYLINGCAVPLTFFILIFFLRQIRNDLRDAEAGQQEDIGGLLVAALYGLVTLQLLIHLWGLLFLSAKPGFTGGK